MLRGKSEDKRLSSEHRVNGLGIKKEKKTVFSIKSKK